MDFRCFHSSSILSYVPTPFAAMHLRSASCFHGGDSALVFFFSGFPGEVFVIRRNLIDITELGFYGFVGRNSNEKLFSSSSFHCGHLFNSMTRNKALKKLIEFFKYIFQVRAKTGNEGIECNALVFAHFTKKII